MENRLIQEEIIRFKLLSGYKTSNTLTENFEVIKEGVGNAFVENIFKDMARAGGQELKAGIESVIRDAGHVGIYDGKTFVKSTNVDDIIKAMEKGTLSSIQEAGKLAKSFFKMGKGGFKESAAEVIVNMGAFGEKYGNLSRKEGVEALMTGPGKYTREEAETLMKTYETKVKKPIKTEPGKPETKKVEKEKIKSKNEPKRVEKEKIKTKKGKETNITKFKNWIKKNPYKTILTTLLAAGGIYLIYKWLTSEDSPFPPCLINLASDEDIEKLATEKLEYLSIKDVANDNLNIYGGGLFFIDKKFTTGNGQMQGTWEVGSDGKVVVDIGGTDYILNCDTSLKSDEKEEKKTGGGGGGGDKKIEEKDCSGLPMIQGCKDTSNEGFIKNIQKCFDLSETGKFDETLKDELSKRGYSTTINQKTYDDIMEKCLSTLDLSSQEQV